MSQATTMAKCALLLMSPIGLFAVFAIETAIISAATVGIFAYNTCQLLKTLRKKQQTTHG